MAPRDGEAGNGEAGVVLLCALPMGAPTKHHFVPAFHISSWCDANGEVCQMRMINGKVVPKRKTPGATGFEEQLYRTEGMGPDKEQHLELNFFKPLDSLAARALQDMLTGQPMRWSSEIRSAWTKYLLSLRYRNPETVKDLREHMANVWATGRQSIKDDYLNRRLPTDPATFEEFEALMNPAAAAIGASNLLMRIIDNDRVVPAIFNMQWSIHHLHHSCFPLVLSDRPFDWPHGLEDPGAFIILPIAPDRVFLAANSATLRDSKVWKDHTAATWKLNKAVVSSAREYVWATDDSQLRFVRKYFGSAPARKAISAEQKESSLVAARGQNGVR